MVTVKEINDSEDSQEHNMSVVRLGNESQNRVVSQSIDKAMSKVVQNKTSYTAMPKRQYKNNSQDNEDQQQFTRQRIMYSFPSGLVALTHAV